MSNRHPIDKLADVRAEIRELKALECSLRQQILDTGDTVGADWTAKVRDFEMDTINAKRALRELGRKVLAPFIRHHAYPQIYLKRREREGQVARSPQPAAALPPAGA